MEINRLAVFSDETECYRLPLEPDKNDSIEIKIRTAKDDADSVCAVANGKSIAMHKTETKGLFDYYSTTLAPSEENVKYYFEIKKGEKTYYYSKVGVSEEVLSYADFVILKGFKTPLWSRSTVMYQIYVDRFCNGDPTNTVKDDEYVYLEKKVRQVKDWNQVPEAEDIRNFYGGDLQGVIDKLPYLKDLGIETIYFNPIFVSPSNHKYDIQDYSHVDPHIGKIVEDGGRVLNKDESTNENASMYKIRTTSPKNLKASDELFRVLVEKAHEMGIRVILDGVFNHCGAFNKWLDRENFYGGRGEDVGAYWSKDSKYNNYFVWKENSWPKNEKYAGWWDLPNHPKLNFEDSPQLLDEILSTAKKWISAPYNADGWRIDVAADLGQTEEYNHKFWQMYRNAVKEANNEAIILAEHYGNPAPWLDGTQWDTIMNYDAFMDPVSYFFTGMEKHSDSYNDEKYNNGGMFANDMVQTMARLPRQTLFTTMNQLSNHDHSRFLTRTNKTVGRVATKGSAAAGENTDMAIMKEAVLFQFTWVGSPTVYYGDEAGVVGWTDPDDRRTYPWGNEDYDLLHYHRDVISLRKRYDVFKTGSTMFLNEGRGFVSYARFDRENCVVVAFNNTEEDMEYSVPVWRTGVEEKTLFKMIFSSADGRKVPENYYKVSDGHFKVKVKAKSGVVIANEF